MEEGEEGGNTTRPSVKKRGGQSDTPGEIKLDFCLKAKEQSENGGRKKRNRAFE